MFVSIVATRMTLSAQELFSVGKMGNADMDNKKRTTKRRMQRLRSEDEMDH